MTNGLYSYLSEQSGGIELRIIKSQTRCAIGKTARVTMNIRIAHEQGRVAVTVFYVQGQINMGSAAQLEQMARAEYDKGMRNLLIDLSETTSLTSAGLRTLLALYRLLDDPSTGAGGSRPKSSHLKLLNVPPDLKRVFQISGFDFFIDLYDDLPTAVASFGTQN